jgi:hypothetical protein
MSNDKKNLMKFGISSYLVYENERISMFDEIQYFIKS